MSPLVTASIAIVAISALSIGALAYLGARRRSVVLFLASVASLWIGVSLALGYWSSVVSILPGRIPLWRHVATEFLALAPMVLLPTAFTIAPVLGRMAMKKIPLFAIAGALTGLPITYVSALAATCYVGLDCP